MVQSVTSSTSVSQTVNAKSKDVQTDTHSVIMRQIMALQAQLKDLYQTMAELGPKDITQRLLLERQIQGIEDEISALRGALIATENKKIMERRQADAEKAQASKPPLVKPVERPSAPATARARVESTPSASTTPSVPPEESLYGSDGEVKPSEALSAGGGIDEFV